jgi:hypothetical protein
MKKLERLKALLSDFVAKTTDDAISGDLNHREIVESFRTRMLEALQAGDDIARIVIYADDGGVAHVTSDVPADAVVLDFNDRGAPDGELPKFPDHFGDRRPADISTIHTAIDENLVDQVFALAAPSEKDLLRELSKYAPWPSDDPRRKALERMIAP